MKSVLILLAFGFLMTACSHQDSPQNLSGDAKLYQQIVGTWHATNGGVIVFGPDGRCSSSFTHGIRAWAYQMTWKVEDGFIFNTVTDVSVQNTTNYEPIGHTSQYKVIHLDNHHLVYTIDVEGIQGEITNWFSR